MQTWNEHEHIVRMPKCRMAFIGTKCYIGTEWYERLNDVMSKHVQFAIQQWPNFHENQFESSTDLLFIIKTKAIYRRFVDKSSTIAENFPYFFFFLPHTHTLLLDSADKWPSTQDMAICNDCVMRHI